MRSASTKYSSEMNSLNSNSITRADGSVFIHNNKSRLIVSVSRILRVQIILE